jgi:hypothetical protein
MSQKRASCFGEIVKRCLRVGVLGGPEERLLQILIGMDIGREILTIDHSPLTA